MIQTLRYWTDLSALVRSALHNPLVVHTSVWRAGWLGIAFVVLQLLAGIGGLAITVAMLAVALTQEFLGWGSWPMVGRINQDNLAVWGLLLLIFGCLCGSVVLYPLNLLAFATRWSDPPRLEELVMTRLTPREMAFGSIFWGIVGGSIVPVAAALGSVLCLIGLIAFELHAQHSIWDDDFVICFFLVAIFVETIPAAAGATIRVWFQLQRRKWPVILLAPAYCAIHVYATGALLFYTIDNVDRIFSWDWKGTAFFLLMIAMAAVVVIATLRSAGKFAPSLFLKPVLPELYSQASVIADCRRRFGDRSLRATLTNSLRKAIPRSLLVQLLAVGGTISVTALVAGLFRPGVFTGLWWNGYWLLAAVPFATVIVLAHEARRTGNSLSFVSGSLDGSLLRRLWPLHLFAILAAACCWASYTRLPRVGTIELILGLAAAALFLAVMFVATLAANMVGVSAWLAPGRLRIPLFAAYLALPLIVCTVLAAEMRRRANDGWDFWPNQSEPPLFIVILVGVILLYRMPAILQRLFNATVRSTPPGTIVKLNPWTGRRMDNLPSS